MCNASFVRVFVLLLLSFTPFQPFPNNEVLIRNLSKEFRLHVRSLHEWIELTVTYCTNNNSSDFDIMCTVHADIN
jgi:hypothetical protein